MKVVVDLDACRGYVCCVMEAPSVFGVDEETVKAVVLDEAPPEQMRAQAERAARACPARAIRIEAV